MQAQLINVQQSHRIKKKNSDLPLPSASIFRRKQQFYFDLSEMWSLNTELFLSAKLKPHYLYFFVYIWLSIFETRGSLHKVMH